MLNRLIAIADQTKSISSSGDIYVENGLSYTVDSQQYFQAITYFTNDKKSNDLGVVNKTFRLPLEEFYEFVKNYKKEVSEVIFEEDNSLKIKTNIPDVELIIPWRARDADILNEKKSKINQIVNLIDKLDLIFDGEMDSEDIKKWLDEKSTKLFVDLTNNKISVSKDDLKVNSEYLRIDILTKCLGKLTKSSKCCKLRVFRDKENEGIFYLKFIIANMKIETSYFAKIIGNVTQTEGGEKRGHHPS
jgi:hypothetical protein